MTKLWLYSIFAVSLQAYSNEYLYPIGEITQDGIEKLCVIHQKNMRLTLWLWDPITKKADKGLSGPYNAAGVAILPSKDSFSFIHNDALYIKDIHKRSASMIDLYGPYDFSTVRWLTNDTCYFSAREREKLNLFQTNRNGDVLRLTISSSSDYIYPQQVGDSLFYIEKRQDGKSLIVKTPYIIPLMRYEDDSNFEPLLKQDENIVLYLHEDANNEISFLTMKNDQEGFFVRCPSILNKNQNFLNFGVFRLYVSKDDNSWHVSLLFSFSLPLFLIITNKNQLNRLYESIVPLLPKYCGDSLYYVDGQKNLCLYRWDCNQNKIIKVVTDNSLNFSPYMYKEVIYYGGKVVPTDKLQLYYQNDEYYIDLPYISKYI
jgi:hypothetical protein